MKTLISTIFLVLTTMSLALAIDDLSSSYSPPQEERSILKNGHASSSITSSTNSTETVTEKSVIPRGTTTISRFLASSRARRPTAVVTCNNYPRMCRAKGSAGPDCCKKRCVDTSADRLNCGMCGKKCKFWEICCKGKCVNPRTNEKNCGSCNNRCKKGTSCVYGMCSYAN